jgi:stage II sporulation protein D
VLAASSPPTLRVWLREGAREVSVRGQSWEIRGEGGRPYARRGAFDLAVRPGAGRGGVLLGSEETGSPRVRIVPEREFALDGRPYAGTLLLEAHDGGLRVVNEVDLETYVGGVIGNEMAPGAPPAAYRAQAVAARTYAWIRLAEDPDGRAPYHVQDTQSSQVYSGLKPSYDVPAADMVRRTAETRGVVLTWRSQPFPAYYSSTCGGHTTDPATSLLDPGGAADVLRGVQCDFCKTSPKYAWDVSFTEEDLVAGLERRRLPIVAPVHGVEISERGPGGWVKEVVVAYGPERRLRRVPGTEFRSALRLLSHRLVEVQRTGGAWHASGLGWGHGVGMCQWGALEMGRRGFSEAEILRWYYPGATFTKVY